MRPSVLILAMLGLGGCSSDLRSTDDSARESRIPAEAQRILLDGDVQLDGQPAGTLAPLRIRTEQLNYDLATSRAIAPGAVSIVLQDHQLEGTGLEADLKTYRARIRADVHGRFTP
ncbi:MAG: LPS export ABC transporter periplasmic protein LptC [Gammaproteobacteria bacterium]|nr:LPS export ABC transporter periplasmic protein LptC [Gammaproteobacteria bacterium]